jgi:hypothetical protein
MSGAGSIKGDGRTSDNRMYEHKLAGSTHNLSGKYLRQLWEQAIRQGYDGVEFVIEFDNHQIRLRASLEPA